MKRRTPQCKAQLGFSLVELMVASTISLLITAALTGVFVANSAARTELDRSSRQIENGRYAMELLAEELRVAGFYGEMRMTGVKLTPASPCALDAAQLGWELSPPLRAPAPLEVIAADAADAKCLAGRAPDTPAVAIRRLSTSSLPPALVTAPNEYLQASACAADPPASPLILGSAEADFKLRNRACTALAPVRRIVQRTYYIASCSNCPGDSIPSLKRVELVDGTLQLRTLAEGIEAVGFDLGLDTNGDGSPDVWRLALDGVAGSPTNDPKNIVAVRLHLLSRTTSQTAGHVDSRAYDLGAAGTVGPFRDAFKRRVYSTVIRLNNPAGRRQA